MKLNEAAGAHCYKQPAGAMATPPHQLKTARDILNASIPFIVL